jgi:integrase
MTSIKSSLSLRRAVVNIKLKGIAKIKAKGRIYYYAWRGGPRLRGEPGSPEFIASYNEAVESRRAPDTGRFRSIVFLYKRSNDYKNLADSTKANWSACLDRVESHFGELRIAQFDRPEKIRPVIRRWRNRWADTPRTADYHMQVLSRVLSYAVDPLGKIASNPCEGIKGLYSGNRSEIIWTDADIAELKSPDAPKNGCSSEISDAVDLAAYTGLRLSDLLRVSWSHIREVEIVITTGKSRHRREARIPLYDELRSLLARMPRRSPTILTNSLGRPWTKNGFSTAFNRAKKAAGIADRNLHFHDLRGTAATRFYTAGIPERAIAEIMAWEEEDVAKIIRRYVSRTAATKAIIAQIDQARRRT